MTPLKPLLSGRRALRLVAVVLILAGLALLWPLARLARAQDGPSGAAPRWSVQPAEATVGDPITLTLTVPHGGDQRLVAPRLPREWGPLELGAQDPVRRTTGADGSVSTLRLQARAFVTGSLALPPLTLSLVDDRGVSQDLAAPAAIVRVRATLKAGDELPRDLRPQAQLPLRGPWPGRLALAAALGGLALVLSGALGLRPLPPPAPVQPPPPPDPLAALRRSLAALDDIDAMGLVAAGRWKTLYALSTDTLRGYLAERWDLPALDLTSPELLAAVAAAGRPRAAAVYLAPLLQEADLVKFARLSPDAARAAGLTDRLRELLRFWEAQG